jgi:hypothetical protein
MPTDSSGSSCVLDASGNLKTTASTDACFGGSARRKQYISEFKAANPRTIVLDGGSAFWGGFMCTNQLPNRLPTPSLLAKTTSRSSVPHFLVYVSFGPNCIAIDFCCHQIVNSEPTIWPS